MRNIVAFFIIILSLNPTSAQENKVLEGIVVSEDLKVLPFAHVYSTDTTILGYTDETGHFRITVPAKTTELLIFGMYLGVEWTRFKIGESCKELEIIMMTEWIYDFLSIGRINKKRYRSFKQLPKIHHEAFKRGIFQSKEPCVRYVFNLY